MTHDPLCQQQPRDDGTRMMTGNAKAHDPLCRWHGDSARWEVCRDCTTIAKARADQTERCIEAMAAVEGGYSVPLGMSVGMFIDAMRQEFIAAALRALEEKPPPLPPSVGVPEKRWFK